jgi:hypothetical protein
VRVSFVKNIIRSIVFRIKQTIVEALFEKLPEYNLSLDIPFLQFA